MTKGKKKRENSDLAVLDSGLIVMRPPSLGGISRFGFGGCGCGVTGEGEAWLANHHYLPTQDDTMRVSGGLCPNGLSLHEGRGGQAGVFQHD